MRSTLRSVAVPEGSSGRGGDGYTHGVGHYPGAERSGEDRTGGGGGTRPGPPGRIPRGDRRRRRVIGPHGRGGRRGGRAGRAAGGLGWEPGRRAEPGGGGLDGRSAGFPRRGLYAGA